MSHYYLIRFSYDGKGYYGLVPQPGFKTIIGDLIESLDVKPIRLRVVSRTDKGVSANENYLLMEVEDEIRDWALQHPKIKILRVFELKRWIKLRKYILGKRYRYVADLGDEEYRKFIFRPKYIVLKDRTKITINSKEGEKVDINKIREACKEIIGRHRFFNFAKGFPENDKCTIYKIDVEKNNDKITFIIEGDRFLHEMIRKLVSFLLSIGLNRFPVGYVRLILDDALLDPKPPSMPPEGLVLEKIYINWEKIGKEIKDILL